MIKYILCDIEGTTTDKAFVYDVLFPYFMEHLKDYAEKNIHSADVRNILQSVKGVVIKENAKSINDQEAIETLLLWTKQDRKETCLKNLQSLIWTTGYQNGSLKGHVYADVPVALRKWHIAGIGLGIYSSGSVLAQKLLFSNSMSGDLTPLFSHYFDTNIGHKQDVKSYINIQKEIDIPADQILFLSDVEGELTAAANAGLSVKHLVREGTIASKKYDTAANFCFDI